MNVGNGFDSSEEEDKVSSEGGDVDWVPSSQPDNNSNFKWKLFNVNPDNIRITKWKQSTSSSCSKRWTVYLSLKRW